MDFPTLYPLSVLFKLPSALSIWLEQNMKRSDKVWTLILPFKTLTLGKSFYLPGPLVSHQENEMISLMPEVGVCYHQGAGKHNP